jgi:hypothetical protein
VDRGGPCSRAPSPPCVPVVGARVAACRRRRRGASDVHCTRRWSPCGSPAASLCARAAAALAASLPGRSPLPPRPPRVPPSRSSSRLPSPPPPQSVALKTGHRPSWPLWVGFPVPSLTTGWIGGLWRVLRVRGRTACWVFACVVLLIVLWLCVYR